MIATFQFRIPRLREESSMAETSGDNGTLTPLGDLGPVHQGM